MPSYYVTSYSGQLSLLPSAGWEMSSIQSAVAVLCVWERNRRFGVALAIRYRHSGISTYGLQGLLSPAEVRHFPSFLSLSSFLCFLLSRFPSPTLPLDVGPLNLAIGPGSAVSSLSGVLGRAPAANAFVGHFEPRKRV